jgi:hypothetical protein
MVLEKEEEENRGFRREEKEWVKGKRRGRVEENKFQEGSKIRGREEKGGVKEKKEKGGVKKVKGEIKKRI